MQPQRFNNLMSELGLSLGRDFSAEERLVWLKKLSDLSDDAIEAAMDRASRECKAFPTVALIREFAAEAEHGVMSAIPDVWPALLRAVKHFGIYGRDPAREKIPALVWKAIGGDVGWEWLCDMTTDQRTHFAAQFRDRYRELVSAENRDRRLPEHLRPRIDNTPVRGLPEPPAPLPALPAPEQPTVEQIEAAKLRVFRAIEERPEVEVDAERFERNRDHMVASAQRMLSDAAALELERQQRMAERAS